VIITSSAGEVFARYNFGGVGDANFSRIETLPSRAFEDAEPGVIVSILSDSDDVVRIFMKLDSFLDRYMYASRTIDRRVIDKLNQTRKHASQFQQLENERANVQFEFTMIFLAISLVILLLAILIGLWLANQIVAPISRLVVAADEIREGNLAVHVEEADNEDEIGVLSRAFNSVTDQLQTQRKELIETNNELDQRSRFTEAVLEGVSVGVIGLNAAAAVDLPNKTALSIFEISEEEIAGHYLPDVIPELKNLVEASLANPDQFIEEQININRQGVFKSLQVRISSERAGGNTEGFVTKIEDLSVKELFNKVKVIINGCWIGISKEPYKLYISLQHKNRRRNPNKKCGHRMSQGTQGKENRKCHESNGIFLYPHPHDRFTGSNRKHGER